MAIFGTKKVDTVHSLKQETEGIVDVFTKALNDLNGVNTKAQAQMEEKAIQIALLQKEEAELDELQVKNSKIIININKFFE